MEVAAFKDARDAELEGFEESFFEEVIVLAGVGNKNATVEDCGGDFFMKELPVGNCGRRKEGGHDVQGIWCRNGK